MNEFNSWKNSQDEILFLFSLLTENHNYILTLFANKQVKCLRNCLTFYAILSKTEASYFHLMLKKFSITFIINNNNNKFPLVTFVLFYIYNFK